MNEKGTTLIELMIVVVIIGILMAIALPAYQSYRLKAYDAATISDLHNLTLFEHSFFTDHLEYASIAPSDKASDGTVSKNITLKSGETALFEIKTLTPDIQVAVNIDSNRQFANVGAYHPGGGKILAVELDFPEIKSSTFSGTLTNADIPAATAANDLAGWDLH